MKLLKLLTITLFSVLAFNSANAQSITVTSPNGGEIWAGCTVHSITWTGSGTSNFYSVDYSTNGGTSWTSLATNLNSTSYSWTVPNTSSTTCLVRVMDFQNNAIVDQSNGTFTINAPLILTAPNGGESWQVGGATHAITWAASGTGTYLTIQYSTDMGATWNTITTTAVATSGTYTWTIPNNPSTNCLVKIFDNSLSCMTDVSNNLFTIAPPTPLITVTAPNTALTYYVANSYNITWTSAYLSTSYVKIEYSTDGGTTWLNVISSTSNTGSYTWVVPNTPSTTCKVKVSDTGNLSTYDVSDVNFTIASAYLVMTTPNGGESWTGCTSQYIYWAKYGTTNNVKLEYSIDNGTTWNVITNSTSGTSYNWTVPNTPSTTCLMRVTDITLLVSDISNANFTILQNTSIIVTAPNGGESWQVGGATHNITWTNSGGASNYYNIYYSTNGGSSWSTIISGTYITSGTYTWTIPNFPSTNCLIKVEDYYNTCQYDVSNAAFTIAAPTPVITVTAPNTAVTYYVANSYNITWTSAYLSSSFVKIDYSIDNGTTWTVISASSNNTGSYTWVVPNTPSTTCLVRVSDFGNSATFDVSNVNFTIAAAYVVLSTPNGGENWTGCSSQYIYWAKYGTTNNVKLEYSIDNGTTWNVITNSTSGTSYNWTVPNTPSTTCLMRVTDITLLVSDVSNATFTISLNTAIIVTAPNGGESWQVGGATHNITWAMSGASNYYNIYYSTNGGSSWTTIISGTYITSNSYTWTIPNFPSTNCLIKVEDYYNTCQYDVSNAVFTIAAPTPVITVTAPNTAVVYYVNNTYNITWTSAYLSSSFVALDYSTNNGSSWISITSAYNNTGSYTWTVPNTPSTTCLVRVSDYGNSATFDVSNVNFTIASPYVVMTTPNGGENWAGCSSQYIYWAKYGTTNNVKLEYSLDNGTTWNVITNSTSGTSYAWSVPNTPSTTCLMRVTDITLLVSDISNATFTISPNLSIIVSAPNGGESWQVGGPTHNITWAQVGASNYYNIYYSTNGGSTWTTIISGTYITSNSYSWTIPNTPSTNCLVKVEDYYNTCQFDVSNAVFTIAAPTPVLTVTAPNTAVTYYVNNSYNITWSSAYLSSSFVKIDYSIDNGTTWTTIIASTSNTGSYTWLVPNTPSTTCLVKVSDLGNLSTYDVSNVNFTIASPYVVLTTPNGGETWNGCSSQYIYWAKYGTTNNVKLEYSLDNGTTWNVITNSTTGTSYTWTVPNTPSTTCLMRVTDVGLLVTDVSNAPFTISQNTAIIVTAPNGGESWQVGGPTHNITWAMSGASNYYNIYYSINGGSTWTTIISGTYITSNSYTWTIPNNPSTNCLIKVEDYYNTCQYDVSNAVFTIAAPTPVITVTAPNTAVTYYVNNSYNITWNSAYLSSSFVKIEYSTDNGANWITITSSVSNTGSYTWLVPNTPSLYCLVRVSDYGNNLTNDVSNVNFIISAPTITVNSPNGGENWTGCSSQTISWSKQGTSNNDKIEVSYDGGTTWSTIISSTSGTSYTWTVPNTPSNNCLIRVTDVSIPAATDVSNAAFHIIQNISIIVNSPNGGEVWQVGAGSHAITWAATPAVSNYWNIDYSTDGGTTWNSIISGTYLTTYTYTWTIPNNPSTNCKVRVSDYYNTCQTDMSDAVFTILAPTPVITVTYPNTATTIYVGSTYNITWTSAYLCSTFVKIEYSTDNGATWTAIISATNNTGSYSWTVPNSVSSTCLIRVTDFGCTGTYDVSNLDFSINPAVIVTAPNGGEILNSCTTSSINWTAGGCSGYYNIDYSTNGGSTWTSVVTYYSAAGTGNCSYTWASIPNIPSNNCLVKVTDPYATSKTDLSNAVFTIAPAITITQPNFGGSYTVGSVLNINWTSSGVSNYYNIDYSINGGSNWINIVFNTLITTNTYAWTVPNAPSTNCLVRVTDNVNNCKTDVSNSVFTITTSAVPITITAPNGGENWATCSSQTITWNATGTSGQYNLDYSINGGTSWVSIATNYAAGGSSCSYSWTVPNSISSSCLVRVTDYVVSTKTDQSDAAFTMSTSVPVLATGGTTICAGASASISASGATSYSWLPSGSLSNASIANPTASPTTTTTYTVTGTAGSCTNTATVTIVVNPIPNITATPNAPNICAGGTVSFIANGATSYSWAPSAGLSSTSIYNPVATPGVTTTYTVTGTSLGCSNSATATVTVTTIPTVNATSGSSPICAGSSTTLTASGATTYTWSPATGLSSTTVATPTASPASTTTYTVTGTTNGCSATSSLTLGVSAAPTVSVTGGGNICAGGSVTLTASGASSYSWSPTTGLSNPNISNPVASPSSTTTYTVTGSNGVCTSTQTVTVSVIAIPVIAITGNTTICGGTSTSLIASGATSYTWSPALGLSSTIVANPTAYPAITTTYTITGVSSGCSGSNTVTVNITSAPTVVVTGAGSICAGSSTNLAASGANTYTWLPTTGLSNPNIANPIASPTTTTTYTVTGNNGCTATANALVTVIPIPSVSVSGTNTICNGGATVLTASGATNYAWLPAGDLSNPSVSNPTATPTTTTTFTVTGSTGSCSSSATYMVTVNPIPTVVSSTDVTICAGSSTNLTSSGATTYSWSPSTGLSNANIANPVATPAATTTYTVTGTSLGCSSTASLTVTVTPLPVINITGGATICNGASTNLSASGASSFSWLPATGLSASNIFNPVASPSSSTTYTVTGTANGCSSTQTVAVNVIPLPTISVTGNTTLCTGTSTTLTASGATSYSWSPSTGLSNPTIANPVANPTSTITYTVTGTTGSCSNTTTVTVSVYPVPVVALTGGTTICSGTSTPLSASGAASYSWLPITGLSSASAANPTASPLVTTTYTVTGTSGSCSDTAQVTVFVNTTPSVSVSGTTNICTGGNTTLTASGAASYSWSPGTGLSSSTVANPVAAPVSTTTYTVTGTTSGCSNTSVVTVTVNPIPVVTATGGTTICSGTSTPISASGATTYSWLPSTGLSNASISNPSASPSSTTTYTVTGTSAGCSSTATVSITVNPSPVASAGSNSNICIGSSTVLNGSGGTTYSWLPTTGLSDPNISNPTANPTSTTTYTVMVGNGTGCTSSANVTVTVTPIPVVSVSGNTTICSGSGTTLTASGATSYSWTPSTGLSNANIANPVASPVATTTYTVTGTTSGCSGTQTVTVIVNASPVATAGSPATICSGTSTTLNATGGGTYSWLPSATLNNASIANPVATPLTTTTYTVTVSNGTCSSTSTVTITVNASPVASAGSNVTIACGGSTTLNATGGTSYSWSPTTGLSNPNIANPVCTPPYTTTYTVTVSNGTCSSTASVTVTTGTLSANAGSDVTICTGSSTSLVGSVTGGGGAWVNLASSMSFTQNVGTYTPITGGTVWLTSASLMDDVVSGSVTIPSFTFNNSTFTNIYISTNGFITFGTLAVPTTTNYIPISSTETYQGAVSAFGRDLDKATAGTPEIRYQQVGQEFIIQWQDMGRYSSTGTLDRFSFQIRLNTTTYQVKVVYNAPALIGLASVEPQVGLRGATSTFGTDVNNRTVLSTTGYWVNSTVGTSNVSTCYLESSSPNTYPQAGTTYTWSLPGTTTYSWAPSTGLSSTTILNPLANPTTTTTYTLTANSGSCTAVDMVTVTVGGSVANAGSDVSICSGSNTQLSATGASSFTWLPATGLSATNIANPIASPTVTTTYTVTGTTGSCTSTDMVVVTVVPQPVANAGADVAICAGSSTTLTASGGTTYSWLPTTGLSNASIANPVASPAATTTYTVTASNGACTSTDMVVVTVNPVPVANAGADAAICSGTNTTLGATGGTSYTWLPATGLSSTTIANPVASPAATTTYTVTVSNGTCTATDAVIVTVNATPTANAGSDVTICNGSTTTLGATGGTTYSWSPSTGLSNPSIANPSANPSATTTYTVTATSNGCSATDVMVVNVVAPPVPNAGADVAICAGSTTTLGASGGTSYTWTPATGLSSSTIANPVASPAVTTTYTMSVSNGTCALTDMVVVTVNPVPVANAGTDVTICSGTNTTLNATGGTSYTWTPSTGLSDPNIANPVASPATTAVYTVTVSNGFCSAQDAVIVNVVSPPVANAGSDVTICSGTNTLLSASGGTSYSWLPATGLSNATVANPIANPNSTTTYTVTVSNGSCSATDMVVVNVNPSPTANAGSDVNICLGNSTTLNGTGGTTYSWSPATGLDNASIANPVATPTVNTTYVLTVSNGLCSDNDTVQVTVNIANAGTDVSICAGGNTTLNAVGGTSYSWLPTAGLSNANIPNPVASPTTTTTYTATVTSTCGTTIDSVVVTVLPLPTAYAGVDTAICSGTTISLQATGGVSYSWLPVTGLSNSSIANPLANPMTSTTYTVTVSDGTCSATDAVVVTVNTTPVANAGSDVSICAGSSATLNASGGTNFAWLPATDLSSAGIANPVANPSATTTYTVTVSNGNCSSTDIVVVTVNNLPVAPASISGPTLVCDGSTNTYSVPVDGNITNYFWAVPGNWTGSSNTNSITLVTNVNSGTLAVTASNQCGSATPVILNVILNPLPIVQIGAMAHVCNTSAPVVLTTGYPSGSGGIYSGIGVSGGNMFDPAVSGIGTFTITYTYTDPTTTCTASANGPMTVDLCNSIGTSVADAGVTVYPNPFMDYATVKIGDGITLNNAQLEVYDVLGKQVKYITDITTHEVRMNRDELNSGIYFFKFINDGKVVSTGRLVIQD